MSKILPRDSLDRLFFFFFFYCFLCVQHILALGTLRDHALPSQQPSWWGVGNTKHPHGEKRQVMGFMKPVFPPG